MFYGEPKLNDYREIFSSVFTGKCDLGIKIV